MKEFKEIVLLLLGIYTVFYVVYLIARPPTMEETYMSCLSDGVNKSICVEYARSVDKSKYVY